jgi:hypothetical protein
MAIEALQPDAPKIRARLTGIGAQVKRKTLLFQQADFFGDMISRFAR